MDPNPPLRRHHVPAKAASGVGRWLSDDEIAAWNFLRWQYDRDVAAGKEGRIVRSEGILVTRKPRLFRDTIIVAVVRKVSGRCVSCAPGLPPHWAGHR